MPDILRCLVSNVNNFSAIFPFFILNHSFPMDPSLTPGNEWVNIKKAYNSNFPTTLSSIKMFLRCLVFFNLVG